MLYVHKLHFYLKMSCPIPLHLITASQTCKMQYYAQLKPYTFILDIRYS